MNTINEVSDALSRKVDSANKSIAHAIRGASDAAVPAAEHLAQGVHHALDRVSQAANQTVDAIEHKGGQIKRAQADMVASCGNYVREKPLTSLGIAVAAGFLVSLLFRAR